MYAYNSFKSTSSWSSTAQIGWCVSQNCLQFPVKHTLSSGGGDLKNVFFNSEFPMRIISVMAFMVLPVVGKARRKPNNLSTYLEYLNSYRNSFQLILYWFNHTDQHERPQSLHYDVRIRNNTFDSAGFDGFVHIWMEWKVNWINSIQWFLRLLS